MRPKIEKKKKEIIARGFDVADMLEHPGWKFWLAPLIQHEISIVADIRKIDDTDVEKSFWKQKIKFNIYNGILNRIDTWIKDAKQLKNKIEGGKHGR